jgi:hypothetical protein
MKALLLIVIRAKAGIQLLAMTSDQDGFPLSRKCLSTAKLVNDGKKVPDAFH